MVNEMEKRRKAQKHKLQKKETGWKTLFKPVDWKDLFKPNREKKRVTAELAVIFISLSLMYIAMYPYFHQEISVLSILSYPVLVFIIAGMIPYLLIYVLFFSIPYLGLLIGFLVSIIYWYVVSCLLIRVIGRKSIYKRIGIFGVVMLILLIASLMGYSSGDPPAKIALTIDAAACEDNTITVTVKNDGTHNAMRCEVYIDDILISDCVIDGILSGGTKSCSTTHTKYHAGWHEIRVVEERGTARGSVYCGE